MNIKPLDVVQFVLLFAILTVSSILFSQSGDIYTRFFIIFVDCVIYFIWGCWHHYTKGRLDKLIVVEYGLVSFVIVLLAAFGLGVIRFFI